MSFFVCGQKTSENYGGFAMNRRSTLILCGLLLLLLLSIGCAQRLQAAKGLKNKAVLAAGENTAEGKITNKLSEAFTKVGDCTPADFKAKAGLLAKAAEEAGVSIPTDDATIKETISIAQVCNSQYEMKVFKKPGKGMYEVRYSFKVASACADPDLKSFAIDNFLVIEVNTKDGKAKVTNGAFDEAAIADIPQLEAALALAGNCTAPLMLASGMLANAVGTEEASVEVLPEVTEDAEEADEAELEKEAEKAAEKAEKKEAKEEKKEEKKEEPKKEEPKPEPPKKPEKADFCATAKCNDDNPCTEDICNPDISDCEFLPIAKDMPCGKAGSKCDSAGKCVEPTPQPPTKLEEPKIPLARLSECKPDRECFIDLSACPETKKAQAWQGRKVVAGKIAQASYLNKSGLMCQANDVVQSWPVVSEKDWWCGEVLCTRPKVDCKDGVPCAIDLASCPDDKKAASWKGRQMLSGKTTTASYLNKSGLMCQARDVSQAWPAVSEKDWWCGEVECRPPTENCKLNGSCIINLGGCDPRQKAAAWQNKLVLSGTIMQASYLNKSGLMCQAKDVVQSWPVVSEKDWWCGEVECE